MLSGFFFLIFGVLITVKWRKPRNSKINPSSTFQSWDWWCTKGKGKVNRCINLIWKVYLLSSPLGHTFLSKVNLSWPKWRQEIPYSLTVHQKFIRKMWWANNGLVEGFNLQLPDYLSLFEIYWGAGERILKVTKKSGNRGRCRKLSLWSSSFSRARWQKRYLRSGRL